MEASRFIARKLHFKGKIAVVSIAISFLVMILAVSISAGFRREIHQGIRSICGDIQLMPVDMNVLNEDEPVSAHPSYWEKIDSLPAVRAITPVIWRSGIVKDGPGISGVLFKGIPSQDTVALQCSIPRQLSRELNLGVGDALTAYFVGQRVKVRKFTIREVYDGILDGTGNQVIYVRDTDLRRVSNWDEDACSALEITVEGTGTAALERVTQDVGEIALLYTSDEEDTLIAQSCVSRYPQLFDWLNLLDFNVWVILILMTVVAGFNMVSGLLILLFRSISTIGTLKSLGMTDRAIGKVFLRVSSRLVLTGMAIGNGLALLFCLVQGIWHLIKLNPVNYFVSWVPVHVNLPLILLADLVAYGAIMLILLIPTLFIARVDPAKTVRTA